MGVDRVPNTCQWPCAQGHLRHRLPPPKACIVAPLPMSQLKNNIPVSLQVALDQYQLALPLICSVLTTPPSRLVRAYLTPLLPAGAIRRPQPTAAVWNSIESLSTEHFWHQGLPHSDASSILPHLVVLHVVMNEPRTRFQAPRNQRCLSFRWVTTT